MFKLKNYFFDTKALEPQNEICSYKGKEETFEVLQVIGRRLIDPLKTSTGKRI